LLRLVAVTQERTGWKLAPVLGALGISARTYRQWKRCGCAAISPSAPRGRPAVASPTPLEVQLVTEFAHRHPQQGYKRICWRLANLGRVHLRPYQIREILREHELLAHRPTAGPVALKRPAPPDHPDQVWHIDLMYLSVGTRWFYLVDILDGYSRYLVHWTLSPTLQASAVTLTTQEALEKLPTRRAGEPQIVHDSGSQFVSAEWKGFVAGVGVRDIRTRIAHPESNGKVERLHRTHREEGLIGAELADYHGAQDALKRWAGYYNEERPHGAIRYLAPAVYYRGDPAAALQARDERMQQALSNREAYWAQRTTT
jgi:putative transposase